MRLNKTVVLLATTLAAVIPSSNLHAADLRPMVSVIDTSELAVFPAPDDLHFLTLNATGANWWQSKAGKILSPVTLANGSALNARSNSILSPDGTTVFTATDSQLVRIQIDQASPNVSSIPLPSIDRLILDPASDQLIAVDHDLAASQNHLYRVDPISLSFTPLPDLPITRGGSDENPDEYAIEYGPLLDILPAPDGAQFFDRAAQGVGLSQGKLTASTTANELAFQHRDLDGLLTRYISDFDSRYAAPGGVLLHLFQPYHGYYDLGYIAFVEPQTLQSEKILYLHNTAETYANSETFVGPLQLAAGRNFHAPTNQALLIEGTRVFILDLSEKEISFQTDLRQFGMNKSGASAAFSADGKSLFLSDATHFARCDIASNTLTANYQPDPTLRIQKIALNANQSNYLALDSENRLLSLSLDRNGARTQVLAEDIQNFQIQGNTASLATLLRPNPYATPTYQLWLADTYPNSKPINVPASLPDYKSPLGNTAIFSPAGSYAFIPEEDDRIIDAFTGETIYTLPSDTSRNHSASSDTSHLAAIDQNEAVAVVSIEQGLSAFDFHSAQKTWTHSVPANRHVFPLFFNDDNQLLALQTNPFELIQLDAETGEPQPYGKPLPIPSDSPDPIHLQVSHDNKRLILAVAENETHIIDLDTVSIQATLPLAAANTAFAFSPKSDFLLAATASGPIEFYSLDQARSVAQLTLFPKTNDWTFVASDHRFETSPDAADTLYTVVDHKIVPGGQLLAQLHEPSILASILGGDLPSKAATQIEGLASLPQVTLALADGTRGLTVEDDLELDTENATATLTLRASGANLLSAEPRLYHNGKLLGSSTRGLTVEDDDEDSETYLSKNYTVPLLPGKNRFRAVVVTASGIESFPASLTLNAQGQAHSNTTSGIALHTLIVGANQYQNPKYNLNYAAADAEAFSKALQAKAANIFTRIDTHLLLDSDATRSNILATFKEIAATAAPRDVFIFYYAGHGVVDETENKQFYLAPANVTQLYGDPVHLVQNGISAQQLRQLSADIAAQKQLFLIDACQSAEALVTIAQRGAAEEKAIAQLARSTGTHWLTASGSQQFATEAAELGHGLFTYALLQALEGAADAGDKRITINELKAYLESQVPQLSQQYRGSAQYPSSYGTGQDFPIAIIP
ncbi:caspase family protein [Pelagicoccus sp. SDUM812002]|uniref:caspase family protein n=1 Tax=Pelagicoccus sp. SDUM812002 TaxID=3041266 RepID=UPI00280C4445|nr:caspase family protein [Pelagicoccus sp. SDUM812002]MDQ8186864.1 caspase family protein [Pelagicoccus sp. SDUM812002]